MGTLANKVCAAIVEKIVTGELAQGAKLNEPDLARSYGISRGPLREAISHLEAMRLIQRIPNIGARVVTLSRNELVEIYHVREALEGLATGLAATHMTSEQKVELQALLDNHEQHLEQTDGQSYFRQQGDMDFHYRIALGSANQRLMNMLGGELYHLMRMYRYQFRVSSNRPRKALAEHQQICTAILEGDAQLAEWLMRRHIRRARDNILSHDDQDHVNGDDHQHTTPTN